MRHLLSAAICATLLSCNAAPSAEDLAGTEGARLDVYFNDPGSRREQIWSPDAVELMIDIVDNAKVSIDFAVMGFSYEPLVEAFVRAYDRGVKIQMVGDAGHLYNYGYQRFLERHIPLVTGNMTHIMHDKFMVVDSRFVMAGTANWTPTDLRHNSNNFFMIDHPGIAADFTTEHAQMFDGSFGYSKVEVQNDRFYQVGDTLVETWFSPNEDAMGRMLELVNGAQESIRFTIFAFTKDQVGSALILKQEEFARKGLLEEGNWRKGVTGVIDQSQLHSNGQYHEVYRLLGASIPMVQDGNDSSRQPGDYQAGGGRLHSKTMIIDAEGENPIVISGSFNWSSSATLSNDEFMMVFHGGRVAKAYAEYYEMLYNNGKRFGKERIGENGLSKGDLRINEIMWYGVHDNDLDGFDQFIELENLTDRDIQLDMWQIANDNDFVVGIPPGLTIEAGKKFSILDHVVEIYQDGQPQDEGSAYTTGNLVINAYNDNRQSRLYLKDQRLKLILKDPDNNVMDVAGDGGPPFAGGPDPDEFGITRSMQRVDSSCDGALPGCWMFHPGTEGGSNVSEEFINRVDGPTYRETIIATPGE